jgi:thiol-disulfide isomerase/thioredoxin
VSGADRHARGCRRSRETIEIYVVGGQSTPNDPAEEILMRHAQITRLIAILALPVAVALVAQFSIRISFATPPSVTSISDAQGRPLDPEALHRKVVMLHFWATWCEPCRREFPVLDRLQGRWGPQGFVIVPVCLGCRGLPAVDAFYERLGIANLAKYTGDMDALAKDFGFSGLPRTFIFDRTGNEGFSVQDPGDWEGLDGEKLRDLIER